ncbi:MAG: glycoside hydrolase family 99-like domain-containing protein [Clostridiales bacterium]|jgi:hypothetical protein|nr:glycoside hydrolase family 99-like domain-containing protein [Clostridiales bacterium]
MSKKNYTVAAFYFPGWGCQNPEETFDSAKHGEWGSLAAGKPLFEGHKQPITPLWGAEDECDPAVMSKKIKAASEHGVDVFIFDWYWSRENRGKGKGEGRNGTLLEGALERGFLPAPNRDDIKFCVMWCNHDVGAGYRMENYAADELDIMCDYLLEKYFRLPNVWRVDGKIVFMIYNLADFIALKVFQNPDTGKADIRLARKGLERFRQRVRDAGLGELCIMCMRVYGWHRLDTSAIETDGKRPEGFNVFGYMGVDGVTSYVWGHDWWLGDKVAPIDYPEFADGAIENMRKKLLNESEKYDIPYYPNLSTGWDNTPRGGVTGVLVNNAPDKFKEAAQKIKALLDESPWPEKIVTVNSWNEWTEGTFLEPDTEYGFGYLEAIKKVFG